MREYIVDPVGRGIVFGIVNEESEDWTIPHPVVRKEDEFGCQRQEISQIEMRLMIADDDRWLIEVNGWIFLEREMNPRYSYVSCHHSCCMIHEQMKVPFLFLRHLATMNIDPGEGCNEQKHYEREERNGDKCTEKCCQGSIEKQRQAIDNSETAKHCIEDADAKEIGSGTEMTHALLFGWVIHIHGNGMNLYTMPRCKDDEF